MKQYGKDPGIKQPGFKSKVRDPGVFFVAQLETRQSSSRALFFSEPWLLEEENSKSLFFCQYQKNIYVNKNCSEIGYRKHMHFIYVCIYISLRYQVYIVSCKRQSQNITRYQNLQKMTDEYIQNVATCCDFY